MRTRLYSRKPRIALFVFLVCVLLMRRVSGAVEQHKRMFSSHHVDFGKGKVAEELRCHCNLPVCVTTGYMCKSTLGTCFTEIVDVLDYTKSRHGCIELLASDKFERCANRSAASVEPATVICCQEDLCNFAKQQPDWRSYSAVQFRNDSSGTPLIVLDQIPLATGHISHKDQWLKAATIAVPIAGGFILILLVLLAIRMLRKDRDDDSWTSDRDYYHIWNTEEHQHHWRSKEAQQPMLSKNPGVAVYLSSPSFLPTSVGHKEKLRWKKTNSPVYSV